MPGLRTAFTDLLNDRWYAMLVTTKYLGGATTARDHRGDPSGRPALTTVPAARQREALAFITEAGFGEQAYRFRPELLSRLGPDRWTPLGCSTPGADGRIDFPLHNWALAQQASLLGQLLDPAVLSRIRDAELRAPETSRRSRFPSCSRRSPGRSGRRLGIRPAGKARAAKHHLGPTRSSAALSQQPDPDDREPAPGTPEDARTLARATLADLGVSWTGHCCDAMASLDPYTRAHLVDSKERISQALNAQMIQTAGTAR